MIFAKYILRDHGPLDMKLLRKDIGADGFGEVALLPEHYEDMWHAYNLLTLGDSLQASTIRKISCGNSGSYKVRTTLTIAVESIHFDSEKGIVIAKGRNIQDNQYVRIGLFHTLVIQFNQQFTIAKLSWDTVSLDRVYIACQSTQNSEIAAVVMHEGLAHVCLVLPNMTLVKAKIEMRIPRKRKGCSHHHDIAMVHFFNAVMHAILKHIDFGNIKCLILGSPGFIKDQCLDHVLKEAAKSGHRTLLDNKSKLVLVHVSSGFKHSLEEALAVSSIVERIGDVKAAAEITILKNFYQVLLNDPERAYYGYNQVEEAVAACAVETLMITDSYFRTDDLDFRAKLVKLVDSVKENGGSTRIFSSLHVSGERLTQLSGIACILRFPLAIVDSDDAADED